jgi:hypothetical protein
MMRKMIAGMKVMYAIADAALADRPVEAATGGVAYPGGGTAEAAGGV